MVSLVVIYVMAVCLPVEKAQSLVDIPVDV